MQSTTKTTKSLIGKTYAEEVLKLIYQAEKTIDILMYEWRWYENDPGHPIQLINHALVTAVRRGVVVRAFLNNPTIVSRLNEVGIKAKSLPTTQLMHIKMFILDHECVVIGSHNLTGSAINSNVEASVVFFDEEVAEAKTNFFNNIWR